MSWELLYDRDGWQVETAIKKKKSLPEWYLSEPDLPEGATFFFEAYADLTTCRPPQGAIPWTAAMLYAEHKQLDKDVADIMWRIVRILDATELKWWNE